MLRSDGAGSVVYQHEATSAIGRFGHSRREACLAKQGGLLVSSHAGNLELLIEQARCGEAEEAAIVVHLGEERFGNAKQTAELGIPTLVMDVEQRCSGRIRNVRRIDLSAGQPPEQKSVDRS